jgi:hypothetical protein
MEEVGVAVRVQGICFVLRRCHQAMVRHHLYRHLRGPCWWMARHTSHVVSIFYFPSTGTRSYIYILKVIWSSGGEVCTRISLECSRVLRRNGAYVDLIHPFMYVTYKGLLAGEVCHDWQSWGVYLGIDSILGQSLLQSTAYILLSVREFLLLCEINGHFHPSSDSFRIKRRRPRNLICPIVSLALANTFDGLLDCERQRFPYRK